MLYFVSGRDNLIVRKCHDNNIKTFIEISICALVLGASNQYLDGF